MKQPPNKGDSMKTNSLNSTNLKNELWKTLKDVKGKKITPSIANSVATQAREILKIVRTEIEISKLTSTKNSKETVSAFLE